MAACSSMAFFAAAAAEWAAPEVELKFELDAERTIVEATLHVARTGAATSSDLVLDGEDLELLGVWIEGRPLTEGVDYVLPQGAGGPLRLVAAALPPGAAEFEVRTLVAVRPSANLALEGLYFSSGNLVTQCEAEGFRRIAYAFDRPDVMSRFTVHLRAPRASFPVLLSNGDEVESGCDISSGTHYAVFRDPWPKPTYLFAVVAGALECIQDSFKTQSGRAVALRIYSEPGSINQLQHAMRALKSAMAWDEQAYGREYDLSTFNIVAVSDFNCGAMENKSLNIFNTKYVLGTPELATDDDLEAVLGVVGHEYFHNWTGNRVTLRTWFDLTLKEGLTVFREQSFQGELTSVGTKRIEDVRVLRDAQFAEDAGALRHPIRPESVAAMDNLYTSTVYDKGAEVIRMYRTLLGAEGFRRGTDLYFERSDGTAVTCDDFRAAMADANAERCAELNDPGLARFSAWYAQPGTPRVSVESKWDAQTRRLTVRLRQEAPAPLTLEEKERVRRGQQRPFVIPVALGALAPSGEDLPLSVLSPRLASSASPPPATTVLLVLSEGEGTWTLQVPSCAPAEPPVLSVLRDFSAPVRVVHKEARAARELAFLMAHDSDAFNRYEAAQCFGLEVLGAVLRSPHRDSDVEGLMAAYTAACSWLLAEPAGAGGARSAQSYALRLPTYGALEAMVGAQGGRGGVDPAALCRARETVATELARSLRTELLRVYRENHDALYPAPPAAPAPHRLSPEDCGRRRLANLCLSYLAKLAPDERIATLCEEQIRRATNMTDRYAALGCLVEGFAGEERAERALAAFAELAERSGSALVVDKYFIVQCAAARDDVLDTAKRLVSHKHFDVRNPNRCKALVFTLAHNPWGFHRSDGAGYRFVADFVRDIDGFNRQLAAKLAKSFESFGQLEPGRCATARAVLEELAAHPGLSRDTGEVVTMLLAR